MRPFLTAVCAYLVPMSRLIICDYLETRCDDGRRGVVRHIQKYVDKSFQPAIFTVDCARPDRNHSSPSGKSAVLLSRIKRDTCMPQACSSSCYASGMSPAMRDCDNLLDYLRNRGMPHLT